MNGSQQSWEASMKPVMEISEINRKAFEKLAELHTHCINEILEANTRQFQAMMGTGDPKAVSELQFNYFKEVEKKLANTAEEELKTLEEARSAIGEIVEESFEHHRKFINELYPQPLKA